MLTLVCTIGRSNLCAVITAHAIQGINIWL